MYYENFIYSYMILTKVYNDYLSDLLLNGLRENFGKDVIDYPEVGSL